MIYRSKLHSTLKRNFQVMPGVEWLELLCKHVPDRHEHMVRYYGQYSSRARGAERERPEVSLSVRLIHFRTFLLRAARAA